MSKKNSNCPLGRQSQELSEWLHSLSYGVDQTNKHRQMANKIGKFMKANGISEYSAEIGEAFLADYLGPTEEPAQKPWASQYAGGISSERRSQKTSARKTACSERHSWRK